MEQFFCFGKKDLCENDECDVCEFRNDQGGVEPDTLNQAIHCVFGEHCSLDRLRELAQADREGRCLILPCKVGDTIYRIHNGSIEKWEVCGIGAGNAHLDAFFDSEKDSNGIFVFVKNRRGSIRMKIPVERFGEVIFLTPEEAKAKLERSAKDE